MFLAAHVTHRAREHARASNRCTVGAKVDVLFSSMFTALLSEAAVDAHVILVREPQADLIGRTVRHSFSASVCPRDVLDGGSIVSSGAEMGPTVVNDLVDPHLEHVSVAH